MFLFESIQMFIRIEGAHDKLMRGAAVGVDQGYVCHHFCQFNLNISETSIST